MKNTCLIGWNNTTRLAYIGHIQLLNNTLGGGELYHSNERIAQAVCLSRIARGKTNKTPAIQYLLEKGLYRHLERYPALIGECADAHGFLIEVSGGIKGELYDLNKSEGRLKKLSQANATEVFEQIKAVNSKMDSVYLLISELANLNTLSDSLLWIQAIDSVHARTGVLMETYGEWLKQLQEVQYDQADEIYNTIQALTSDSLYFQNELIVASIYLNTYAKGDSIGAEAQAVLLGIAGQCPNTGGDAVYRARSLYQLQHPEMRWEDGVLCEPAARNVMWGALPVQATVSRLKVWPNPTKGMLFLEIPSACGVELRLQVLDMLGRTVKNIALETDSSPASIPLKGMNGGIYFLKLFCQGQLIGSEKIILSNN